MQKFDFTAPASGASQTINAPGRYLKYVAGTAGGSDTGLILTPGGKPGSKILLYPGQAITLPGDGTAGPNAWTIANALGQAQISGIVVIGNGRLDDNTLQGTVQVVDGGKARTLAGSAYVAVGGCGAVAATYGHWQLWNPAASGKRLIVKAITAAPAGGMGVDVGFSTAVLTGSATATSTKLAGGAASSASMYSQNNATLIGGTNGYEFVANFSSGGNLQYVYQEPIVVPPGWGLTMRGEQQNVAFNGIFEYTEEPNV
ncbi:hypothetical protein [Burkholderia sp. lyk4-R2A-23]|uniref:hypothetical protein n=1 Tax=Burkholderia sp. lyk4-R2A-23 TaxID=3040284 RepID=UPI00254F9B73|nr:hypothetical protein [Burkholderia sp. lyk4-R2A-23]